MTNATTIRPEEAAHFGRLAAEWWDPKGSSAMLHRLNPVRLGFIRDAIDAHWPAQSQSVRPLSARRALDVGCGAGLLCEPLTRLGASVTGVEPAAAGFIADCEWTALGTVGHWGHSHTRVNRYTARVTVQPVQGEWKLTDLEVREARRL